MKSERAGNWWGLPWYQKLGRWLRLVPLSYVVASFKALRHNPRRCLVNHPEGQPCPGDECTYFTRREMFSLLRSIRSVRLGKTYRVWWPKEEPEPTR